MSKVVIVTGSRIWHPEGVIWTALDYHRPTLLVHGACRGADLMAQAWAITREVDYLGMPARWRSGGELDKGAGFARNQRMLERFPSALVLAFPAGKASGTKDCIRRGLELGRVVWVYGNAGVPVIHDPALRFPNLK